MSDEHIPSLSFHITPTARGPVVRMTVCVREVEESLVVEGKGFLPIAAVLLRFKIEAGRERRAKTIGVDEIHFGDQSDMLGTAWNFLKNRIRTVPIVKTGDWIQWLQKWVSPRKEGNRRFIEVDAEQLLPRGVWFGVVVANGSTWAPFTDDEHLKLFEYLTGRCSLNEFFGTGERSVTSVTMFKFGQFPTGTTVVHAFRGGLRPDAIKCSLTGEAYSVPEEIGRLVDRAQDVFVKNAPGILKMGDEDMLAPQRFTMSMAELERMKIEIAFCDSNYRYYAAFAFAEFLENVSSEFAPLREFATECLDPIQPARATCSMGVRVVLETSDNKIIVARRSSKVKQNTNVWSVSANEGVRRTLLSSGRDCSDLLEIAVFRAVENELLLPADKCHSCVLLSIYHNKFNQWGAGFALKTDLTSTEVVRRQSAARHAFEHERVTALPIDVESCGRSMRERGERWYGGALESLSQFLAWRRLQDGDFETAEEVACILANAAGGVIMPIDQANAAMLPIPGKVDRS